MKPDLNANRVDAELRERLEASPEVIQRVVRRSLASSSPSTTRRPWRLVLAAGLVATLAAIGFFWPSSTRVEPGVESWRLSNAGGEMILSRDRGSNPVLFVPRTAPADPEVITIRNIGSVISVASSADGPRLLLSKGES